MLNPDQATRRRMSKSARARTDDRSRNQATKDKIGAAHRGVPERPDIAQINRERLAAIRSLTTKGFLEWLEKQTPERRSAMANPLVRYQAEHPEQRALTLAAAMTPEARKRARENQLLPEPYTKMVAAGEERWTRPEYRATVIPKIRERAKQRWSDPDYKSSQVAKMRAGRKPKPQAACGTAAGYMRHIVKAEKPCDACREARNKYRRESRESSRRNEKLKVNRPSRQYKPCGTRSSYIRNKRLADRGEPNCGPCEACVRAAREYKRKKS